MNGYSKIKLVNSTTNSRSIDLSDLLSFPQPSKPTENNSPNNNSSKTQEVKQIIKTTNSTHEPPSDVEDEDDEHGINAERFGVKLSRNYSVSSTTSYRFRLDNKQSSTTTTLQSAVTRAFSMRRSSSVSEKYCRIHDQCVTLASPLDDDDPVVEGMDNNNAVQTRSMKKKNSSSGRILKACKRLLGL